MQDLRKFTEIAKNFYRKLYVKLRKFGQFSQRYNSDNVRISCEFIRLFILPNNDKIQEDK
jgi:hypothetical protein